MEWSLIGIWPWIAVVAVIDFVATTIVALLAHAPPSVLILVVMLAFTSGAATIAALAFWSRDRWLRQTGIIRR